MHTDTRADLPPPTPPTRIVPRRPGEQIRRAGLRRRWHHDLYHRMLTLRWWQFMAAGGATYLTVNLVFACLYVIQPGAISGARDQSFIDAFFFSVQTIATIGYGQMSPATLYANLLVTIETMAGLVFLALATGITFARISRPTARVMFARTAVVTAYDGTPTLQFRLANERQSQILEADVAVALLRYETTSEGQIMRRFHDLPLLRSHTPVFSLSFTIMHPIGPGSPFHGATPETLRAEGAELLVTVTGLEEVTSQTVHARHSYDADEIRFGHRFRDIFRTAANGARYIDYTLFHHTDPAASEPAP